MWHWGLGSFAVLEGCAVGFLRVEWYEPGIWDLYSHWLCVIALYVLGTPERGESLGYINTIIIYILF